MNSGIFLALSAAFFFGTANMVDAQLSRKEFKSVGTLLFYSCAFNLIFTLPVALHPQFALSGDATTWALLFLSSQLHLLSYYLLYNALKRYETSVITCVTTLSLALVPVVSALTGYEALNMTQWVGFALCVASAIALSWRASDSKSGKKGILFAACCGVTFCACAFLDDHLSSKMHWSALYAGIQCFMMVTMALCLFGRKFRGFVAENRATFSTNLRGFFASELAFALGTILAINAYKATKVSVVEAIIASMPVMIFVLSFVIPQKWRHEDMSPQQLPRKILCFATTIIGIYLLY